MSKKRSISILFLGDVIGKPGRAIVKKYLAEPSHQADLIIANVENAAHGFGTSLNNLTELRQAGVKVFTGGNHTFDRKETFDFIENEKDMLRPANYPEGTPGQGHCIIAVDNISIGILNLMGRVFMEPLRSPFLVADQCLSQMKELASFILVDMHAEATAEKIAMGWYLDGQVAAVLGSHTHVQTADERILPKGTAYITDVGCCGPYNGVIGMEQEGVFRRLIKQLPTRFEVAGGQAMLNGVRLELNIESGQTLSIRRVQFLDPDSDN